MVIDVETAQRSFDKCLKKFDRLDEEFNLMSSFEKSDTLKGIFRALVDVKYEICEKRDVVLEELTKAGASSDEVSSNLQNKIEICNSKIKYCSELLSTITKKEIQHEEKMEQLRVERSRLELEVLNAKTNIDESSEISRNNGDPNPVDKKPELFELKNTSDETTSANSIENLVVKLTEAQCKSNMELVENIFTKLMDTGNFTAKSGDSERRDKPMVQLNKLDPPSWEGNPRDYYDFKNRFIAAMKRGAITDEYLKMTYLVKAVKHPLYLGRVKNCQSLDTVWPVIEMHISKIDVYELLIDDFKNIKPIYKKDSNDILNFTSELAAYCRRVRDLDMEACLTSVDFMLQVKSKLNGDLCRDIHMSAEMEAKIEKKNFDDILNVDFIIQRLEKISKDFKGGKSELWRVNKRNVNSTQYSAGRESTHQGTCNVGSCSDLHSLQDCPEFRKLNHEDKVKHIYSHGYCFRCLENSPPHIRSKCTSSKVCSVCHRDTHHELLHKKFVSKQSASEGAIPITAVKPSLNPFSKSFTPDVNNASFNCIENKASVNCIDSGNTEKNVSFNGIDSMSTTNNTSFNCIESVNTAYLPYVTVKVMNGYGKLVFAKVLIDGGSNCSLIRNEFARLNGLNGDKTCIQFEVAGGKTRKLDTYLYKAHLSSIDDEFTLNIEAFGLEKVCGPSLPVSRDFLRKFTHLDGLSEKLESIGGNIDILIGRDFQEAHAELERVNGLSKYEPTAIHFPLGWCIVGGRPGEVSSNMFIKKVNHISVEKQEIQTEIRSIFLSDFTGVMPSVKCLCSEKEIEESRFIKLTNSTIKFNEAGRIEVSHPWKPGFPHSLPDNRKEAYRLFNRFYSELVKKDYFEDYSSEMLNLLKNGLIRKIPSNELNKKRFFLTNHAVLRPEHESTKLRIVWNAAKSFNDISLNECIEKGPDLLNSLFAVLIKWREFKYAIGGDIKKMFNQIAIDTQDQPYFSFFWKLEKEKEPMVFEWTRLIFGTISSPDISSFSLKFLGHEFKHEFPVASKTLDESVYVDDILDSFSDIEVAKKAGTEINELLDKASFSIKGWHSNSENVEIVLNGIKLGDETYVLGHAWKKTKDSISLKLRSFNFDSSNCITKRSVLSCISTIWDPLGLMSPLLIELRVPFQELWKRNLDWNEPLSEDEVLEWKTRFDDIEEKINIEIPRILIDGVKFEELEIHTFSDGAERCYGACCFIRYLVDGKFVVRFVASKSLLVPIRGWTIPRTELVALLIGTRLCTSILKAFRSSNIKQFYWSDSLIVMHWVKKPANKFKPFVETRLSEILEKLEPSRLFYIPSKLNAADVLTKTGKDVNLLRWYEGPNFLKTSFDPSEFIVPENINCVFDESEVRKPKKVKKKKFKKLSVNVNSVLVDFSNEDYMFILSEAAQLESWNDILCKVCKVCLGSDMLTPELRKLSCEIIYRALQSGVDFVKEKVYTSLCPYLDMSCGLWKVGTRIHRLKYLPPDILAPIIIPKFYVQNRSVVDVDIKNIDIVSLKFIVLKKVLFYYHSEGLHLSANRINTDLHSSGLWLVNGVKLLRHIEYLCEFCRKRKRPLQEQKMGELPEYRMKPFSPAFDNTSLDMFGPVNVKLTRNTTVKGHIAIFVCMVTRAIHLEICYNHVGGDGLSTESFMLAFRRFINHRGIQSSVIFADQGSNFMGAIDGILSTTKEWNEIIAKNLSCLYQRDIKWIPNIPNASHMNGCTERMIRWCRKALDATIEYHMKEFYPNQWFTFLAEVTYLVNSRPIFPYSCSNPLDEAGYISPNSILYGHNIHVPQYQEYDSSPRNKFALIQKRIQVFWDCFLRYMPQNLLTRRKWSDSSVNINIGDYVILMKETLKSAAPRALWDTAVVIKTYPGIDGLVRKVRVKTSKGEYDRPVHKLCVIATDEEIKSHVMKVPDSNITSVQ